MSPSSIEWTDKTWNPTLGCSVTSPGCDNCYAARVALRGMTEAHKGLAEMVDGVPRFTGEVRLLRDRLDAPLHWRTPRRVFVDSMSDLFHPGVPISFILSVFRVMGQSQRHTYQILTKRPKRMASISRRLSWGAGSVPLHPVDPYLSAAANALEDALPNVWLGTSIESDDFTWRARELGEANAAVRFLSLEPLLGPLPSLDLAGIDWVIVGSESGPRARPCDLGWVREIRDRCAEAGVPLFVKQLASPLLPAGHPEHELGRFPLDLQVREYPA